MVRRNHVSSFQTVQQISYLKWLMKFNIGNFILLLGTRAARLCYENIQYKRWRSWSYNIHIRVDTAIFPLFLFVSSFFRLLLLATIAFTINMKSCLFLSCIIFSQLRIYQLTLVCITKTPVKICCKIPAILWI